MRDKVKKVVPAVFSNPLISKRYVSSCTNLACTYNMETKVGISASIDHPSDDNPLSPGSESEAEVDGGTYDVNSLIHTKKS